MIKYRTKDQLEFLRNHHQNPYMLENVLTNNCVAQLLEYWKNNRHRETLPNHGSTLRFGYEWKEVQHILSDLVNEIHGTDKWQFVSGRLYYQHGVKAWDRIHTDNFNKINMWRDGKKIVNAPKQNGKRFYEWIQYNQDQLYLPWKTIVLPLQINGPASTVVFEQKYYGCECINWNKDHDELRPNIDNYDETKIIDSKYKKFVSHIGDNLLKGLAVHDVYEWKVGNALVWDSTQLHVSGAMNTGETKIGITIWTQYPDGTR